MTMTPGTLRSCGECTACCTVLAVDELRKPMRWACDHIHCAGCRIYDTRPQSCREFNCLWLLGEIPGDERARPDRLGVIFDGYQRAGSNESRFVALEIWDGAFAEPAAAALIDQLAAGQEVQLSYRDGRWRTMGARSTTMQDAPRSSECQDDVPVTLAAASAPGDPAALSGRPPDHPTEKPTSPRNRPRGIADFSVSSAVS